MTDELLETILNNSEFTDCINDAAPTQVKILQDYKPQMKELQARYLELMEEADYHGVSEIKQKLRLDKKDETAKIDYNSWKKKVMNEFKATLKALEIGSSAVKVASVNRYNFHAIHALNKLLNLLFVGIRRYAKCVAIQLF